MAQPDGGVFHKIDLSWIGNDKFSAMLADISFNFRADDRMVLGGVGSDSQDGIGKFDFSN